MTFVKKIIAGLALVGLMGTGTAALAAGGKKLDHEMKHVHWHFKGPLGTYDRAAAQRGFQVYQEVCASCHELEHLAFRHLGDKGAPYYDPKYPNPNDNPYVKSFAAAATIDDIDEFGDKTDRSGKPADKFPRLYANKAQAASTHRGAIPPDLSLIVAARTGGADYLYNLLLGYDAHMPKDFDLGEGTHFNPVMDGGAIAMADPLEPKVGNLEYADGTKATKEQMAKDVTEFLAWAADPKMEQRKGTGLMVMIYLLILSILLYFSYKRVWRNVEH